MKISNILLLLTMLCSIKISVAQVRGKVTDSNNLPLENADVIIKGTQKGSTTNKDGIFMIENLKQGNYTLRISMMGYKTKEVLVSTGKKLNKIQLKREINALDEVLVNALNRTKTPSSALRLKTPIKALPQNIQVVSNEILEDQQINNILEGAIRNVSGVSNIEHWGHFARINMRGFRLPAFRNGVNVQDMWGPLSEDMFMVDRIEFVKGPSGFMMSAGEPGGFYNVVTKKPTANKIAKISLTAGTQDTYRGAVDFGGKIGNDERFLYRVNAMYQVKGTHQEHQKLGNRFGFAPALSYQITPKTKFLTEFSYQRVKTYIGNAYVFNTPDKGYGSLDRDFSMIDGTFPATNINEISLLNRLTHNFNDNWQIEAQYVMMNYDQEGASFWTWSLDADGNADRRAGIWDAISEGDYFQIYLSGKFSTGSINHKIMGGFDFTEKRYWANFYVNQKFASPFNINSPTYYSAPELTFDRNYNLKDSDPYYGSIIRSFYAQDEISFLNDKVRVTLAGRYTQLDPQGRTGSEKIEKFTPRVGLSVDILPQLTAYGLYDQSFLPNNVDVTNVKDGVEFDPIEGSIYEGGLKSRLFDNKLNASLSVYRIIKNNLPLTSSEINATTGKPYIYPDSEVTSEGFEVDIQGKITDELGITLNYANTNVEDSEGNRIAGHAKHITNGWVNYNFAKTSTLKSFGLSLGYQYQVERSSGKWKADNKTDLPDYFRLDGAVSWKNNKWRIGLNINNILDEYLYSGANYSSYLYWQSEPGTNGRISVSYNF